MVRFSWLSHIEPYQGATDSTISNKVIARRYIGLAVHRGVPTTGAPKKRKGETSGQQTQGNANYFEGGSSSSPALTLVSPTNFSCQWDGCEQVFDNEETFVEHVKAHVNMEKDNKCHWRDCEREEPFQRSDHLKQHIVGHTGVKLYVCEYVNENGVRCDKSYTQSHNLKKHKQTHAAERIIYKCAYPPCTKTYLNQNDKVKHERSHTDPNFYQCPLDNCRKLDRSPNTLRDHFRGKHKSYGTDFWASIVKYKKDNKLKSYGLIGMTEDGILYKRNDNGAGSSNANNQVEVGQTTQGVQEHFVHPTYQHGGELQLFPTNVEHQEDHQNEEYYQGNYPYEDEDVNTDLGL
uniref:C2H2-type domain-containing protein n=1 Tax=Meloidogyne incognita TaxID=6306 RepID=A0A914M825_MELIC